MNSFIFQAIKLRDTFIDNLYYFLIRTIRSDDLWMSEAYDANANTNGTKPVYVAINFTWRLNVSAIDQILPTIEAALLPFNPRPHWGKYFKMNPADIMAQYPQKQKFM